MAEQRGATAVAEPDRPVADGVYVYSVVESTGPRSFGKIGIGGRGDDVYTVHYRELAAVLSRTPVVVYDPTRENALAHERVNEVLIEAGFTPVPMSFGTIFTTEKDALEFLKDTYDALRDVLERRRLGRALEQRVHELEEANARIAELNSDLERRVDEATAELREAVAHLRELDDLKSQFLSIASHELRTPITAVSGFAQLALRGLRERLAGALDEDARGKELRRLERQLTIIQEQSARLGRLVRELLDVSRIQSGQLAFDLVETDVAELVRTVAEQTEMTAPRHRVEVEAHGDTLVLADRDHLEQVIANLVDNAVKYSPDGGLVSIRVSGGGEDVGCTIEDRGIGIPPDQLLRVFDPFFRTHEAEVRRTPGLGLGLYIARGIVERHGGRIWAESVLGQGTRVHVSLPSLRATASEAAGRDRALVG